MSKYLFLISHPAHFHMFKYTMQKLKNNEHEIVAVIRPKDVLEELCKESGLNYIKVNERRETKSMFSLGISLLSRIIDVWKIVKKRKTRFTDRFRWRFIVYWFPEKNSFF